MDNLVTIAIKKQGETYTIQAQKGDNLRKVLLKNKVSPYSKFNQKLNCGGNGICATCGIFILSKQPKPIHWHDKLAAAYSYPRLSCQITIDEDMEIEIPPKIIWGNRRK